MMRARGAKRWATPRPKYRGKGPIVLALPAEIQRLLLGLPDQLAAMDQRLAGIEARQSAADRLGRAALDQAKRALRDLDRLTIVTGTRDLSAARVERAAAQDRRAWWEADAPAPPARTPGGRAAFRAVDKARVERVKLLLEAGLRQVHVAQLLGEPSHYVRITAARLRDGGAPIRPGENGPAPAITAAEFERALAIVPGLARPAHLPTGTYAGMAPTLAPCRWDKLAAMRRVYAAGRADPAFVALLKAHPDGPPPDVVPPLEDGARIDLPKIAVTPLSLFGSPSLASTEGA